MYSKKISWWVIVLILLALIIGFVTGNFISGKSFARKFFLRPENKIDVVLDIINEEYVDKINMNDLMEGAIPKIIGELDPHSNYIPSNELAAIKENMDGHFAGFGIEYLLYSDTLYITGVIHGSPSEQAGLLTGDRIVMINDSLCVGSSFSEEKIQDILRGEIGTTVKFGIKRLASDSLLQYRIARAFVPVSSIKAAYEVAEGVGLIKIYDTFTSNTYNEFINAMAKLLNKGCKSFILDLRMNKGGSFEAAVNICNEFLPKGKTIVYTQGKSFPREDVFANGLGTLQDNQIVILMDQASASASEIVAGAIQDNDRGLVIGRRSFGKGLVQNQIELSDGSALRLTIARYFTPSGRNIQRKYEMGKADAYNKEWIDRFSNGEEFYEDSVDFITTSMHHTLAGRPVYGGGGIMPDIFISLDTTELTSYYLHLKDKDVFRHYAFLYADANRSKLKTFTDYKNMANYLKTQYLLSDVVQMAERDGIKKRSLLINISANQILNTVHAYIVGNFFGEEALYAIILDNDLMVKQAIDIIQKGLATPESVALTNYKTN
ncbi:MAG: S41 family peptidase [Candidatus Symbiothrix sp.]|jgi:carboxyl-terminal processing protease|nr:S41 family peptidase [Candidatus Symbiothrix sp.]